MGKLNILSVDLMYYKSGLLMYVIVLVEKVSIKSADCCYKHRKDFTLIFTQDNLWKYRWLYGVSCQGGVCGEGGTDKTPSG